MNTRIENRKPAATLFFLSLALITFWAATAHADSGALVSRINVVGDLNYNVYSQDFNSGSVTSKGALGYGGGALVDFGVANELGFETGLIYFVRKVNVEFAPGTSFATIVGGLGDMNVFHIPGTLVAGMGSVISLVGGVFYEIPSNSNSGDNNFGLGGGLRFNIPANAPGSALIDLRFNHGLTNQGGGFHTNDIHLLAGFSFGGI